MSQAVIAIDDRGDHRHVRVLANQRGHYRPAEFTTTWPAELLQALADLKGEWFCDSYERFENPNYIQKQIDQTLDFYGIELAGLRILDFGCGFGASSYCLMKRGATSIVATDLVRDNTDLARRIFTQLGLADRIDIRQEDVIPKLEPASFDCIWLQAVVEHLLPEERRSYLPRFWQALRPGGWLVVTETPNRLWPYESHTTGGRWFIPWMPPQKAFRTMRGDERYRQYSDTDFYRSGIVGSSYAELLDCLGRPADCEEPARRVGGYFTRLYRDAKVKTPLRRAVVGTLGLLEPAVRTVLRRPVMAFTPFLNHIAFRKRQQDGSSGPIG
jgi:2-polyprenyl-3-methyl-5-hydroxy-6-metoxy-1,4-benzoquinol methylase